MVPRKLTKRVYFSITVEIMISLLYNYETAVAPIGHQDGVETAGGEGGGEQLVVGNKELSDLWSDQNYHQQVGCLGGGPPSQRHSSRGEKNNTRVVIKLTTIITEGNLKWNIKVKQTTAGSFTGQFTPEEFPIFIFYRHCNGSRPVLMGLLVSLKRVEYGDLFPPHS